MDARNLFFLVLYIYSYPGRVTGLYKRWLPNANFNNPYNWNKARIPCGNDKVLIHEEGPVIYVQINTTIQEMILPSDGEIIFGPGSSLAFTNTPDHSASCLSSGTEVEYNVTYPSDWLDPRNWCPSDSETGPCKTLQQLDSEMIPCQNDDVIFPKDGTYFVNLESSLQLKVNTLKLSGKAYTTNSFISFLNTTEGRKTFPLPNTGGRSSIQLSRRKCVDPTGCICGNSQPDILGRVCKFRNPYCPRIKCSSPIKPESSCCEICGAILKVEYGTGFKFDDLRNGLQRSFLDGETKYRDVGFIVSKISEGTIQVVLSDTSGIMSIQVAKAMKTELDDYNAGGFKYAVRNVQMVTSSGSAGGTTGKQTGNKVSMPGGEIAGIVVGLIAVLAMIVLIFFVYRKKKNGDDIGFKVFDKVSFGSTLRKPRLEVPPSLSFRFGGTTSTPETVGATSQGFDNPMYGSNPLENEKPMCIEMTPTEMKLSAEEEQPTFDNSLGFDNPLYDSTVQESLFNDPAAVEASTSQTKTLDEGPSTSKKKEQKI